MVSFKNSYHGSTQGALSVMGSEYWQQAFRPLLPGISQLDYNDIDALNQITEETACVIAETIQAEAGVNLPNQSWQIKAAGPAGVDHILVMVSDSPRDLKSLEALGADPNSPFVYALNNLKGRGTLIDYLTGKSSEGKSEKFAAKIVTVSEVQ